MALSFLPESLRRQLEAFDPSATPQDSEAVPLSESERVEELLAGLEFAAAPTGPRGVGKARNILGNIAGGLGDALIAAGNIRAGGQSRGFGPFRQERLMQEQAALARAELSRGIEDANRRDRNAARIRVFNTKEAERRVYAKVQADIDEETRDTEAKIATEKRKTEAEIASETRDLQGTLDLRDDADRRADEKRIRVLNSGAITKDRTVQVTQREINRYGLPQSDLGKMVNVRDRINKSGFTVGSEVLGEAKPGAEAKATTREFDTTITKDMVARFGFPEDSVGTNQRVRDILNPDGSTDKREILGPPLETKRFIETDEGIVPVGTRTGNVGELLVSPVTGKPMRPFREELLSLRLRNEELTRKRAFMLPPGTRSDLTDSKNGMDAAFAGLGRYLELGSPELNFPSTLVQGTRLESPERTTARRVLSEAIIPIRKFFAGTAVTPTEAKASAPLIVNLEEGASSQIIIDAMIGLTNLSRRNRMNTLLDSRAVGLDISGFEHELTDGSLVQIRDLEHFRALQKGGDHSAPLPVVDENGMLMMEDGNAP